MAVEFFYGEHQGWLHCGLTVKNSRVIHSVDGWQDGLGELLAGILALFGRAIEATASFQEEPGEFRWRIVKLTSNRVRIRVTQFDDWGLDLPDDRGRLLFDEPCGLMSLAMAVHAGSEATTAHLSPGERPARAELGDLLRKLQFR